MTEIKEIKLKEWYTKQYPAISIRQVAPNTVKAQTLKETEKATLLNIQGTNKGLFGPTRAIEIWVPKSAIEA